jgi:hypothetical protein
MQNRFTAGNENTHTHTKGLTAPGPAGPDRVLLLRLQAHLLGQEEPASQPRRSPDSSPGGLPAAMAAQARARWPAWSAPPPVRQTDRRGGAKADVGVGGQVVKAGRTRPAVGRVCRGAAPPPARPAPPPPGGWWRACSRACRRARPTARHLRPARPAPRGGECAVCWWRGGSYLQWRHIRGCVLS